MLAQVRSLILPFTAALVIPALLVEHLDPRGAPPWRWAVGGALLALGFAMLVWTVRLFVRIGRGTLAPWDPTRKLVVRGPYAHVRNPMISGVATIIAGEAILFASPRVAAWAGLFIAINHVYFVLSEEPGLRKRFGDEYVEYCAHVPRWIPSPRGWKPG